MWMKPRKGFSGNHIFVTDGRVAFDYHGYSVLERLLKHQEKVWASQFGGWEYDLVPVDFPLLETAELNARNMRGPDQYHGDAIDRTSRYLTQIDHERQKEKVKALL